MARQANAAPVIIRRKKIVAGGGHHGGAWKVAYADFVTAMMAFFLLMWLLNATTENQRKGLADYFSPTIPIHRVSGGGDGAFGGNSVFSEDQTARDGRGATERRPEAERQALGSTGSAGADSGAQSPGSGSDQTAATNGRAQRDLEELHQRLLARGGESMATNRALRHIVTRLTDEGLVIEIFDLPDAQLFRGDGAEPTESLREVAGLLVNAMALVTNFVAIEGHVRAYPVVLSENPVWGLSADRAQAMRRLLESAGLPAARMRRVTGHADRRPAVNNAMALRNNRLEIIVLRDRLEGR
jgi:chemotaxis protein MotB